MRSQHRKRLLSNKQLFIALYFVSLVVAVQCFQTIGMPATSKSRAANADSPPEAAWTTTTKTSLSYSSRTSPPPPQCLQETVINKLVADTATVAGQRKTEQQLDKSISSLIQEVTTMQEFDDVILSNARRQGGDDVLTVVRFHAPFCPACKASEPAFHQLIYKHQKQLCEQLQLRREGRFPKKNAVGLLNIHWVSVALTRDNDDLREKLDLEVIPFGQIYHSSVGLVEGLNIGRKYITDFDQILQTYVSQKCYIPEDVGEPEAPLALEDDPLEDPSVVFLNDDDW
jgi:thiol-disulfide isomerase/thioredoxin